MPSSEGNDRANATQREKYGDGYSKEMARRNSMRKTRGTGNWLAKLKKEDPEAFEQFYINRGLKRKDAGKDLQEG